MDEIWDLIESVSEGFSSSSNSLALPLAMNQTLNLSSASSKLTYSKFKPALTYYVTQLLNILNFSIENMISTLSISFHFCCKHGLI